MHDVNIDELYIPLPTTLYLQYVKQAISAGKHAIVVVVETRQPLYHIHNMKNE